jgi:hypothetical protein
MKLPNPQRVIIDVEKKLRGYCLNMNHSRGAHKARVFASTLGITAADPAPLVAALRRAALENEAKFRKANDYGKEYELEFRMEGPKGAFIIISAWFIDNASDVARLTNCYIDLKKSKRKRP